ncbi:MAG: hypothetical protein ABEJ04_03050 [Halobacteriaceae archaeon]
MSEVDLEGRVFVRRTGDEADVQYAYVAEEYEEDGERRVLLWRYDRDVGFRAKTRQGRERFLAGMDTGEWTEVERLPDEILAQVSGDEVPSEHSA